MRGYLGEHAVRTLAGTPFDGFTAPDWALYIIDQYGGIDGEHHQQWVIDTVARVLHGAPVTVCVARGEGGHSEYRVDVGESATHDEWIARREADGYEWDKGIAP